MKDGDSPRHWLIVSSPQNYQITCELGFAVQGIKSRHRSRASQMREGDRLLWYLTGMQVFAATATVRGSVFEERTGVWVSLGKPDDYPWRVPLSADVVLESERGVPVQEVRKELEYLRKWPEKHWRLGFQGMLHRWPEEDFRRVEGALRGRGEAPAV
jgi:hypothetical protein